MEYFVCCSLQTTFWSVMNNNNKQRLGLNEYILWNEEAEHAHNLCKCNVFSYLNVHHIYVFV